MKIKNRITKQWLLLAKNKAISSFAYLSVVLAVFSLLGLVGFGE